MSSDSRIGADVRQDIGVERQELAALVERALERDVLVAAVIARDQVFPAGLLSSANELRCLRRARPAAHIPAATDIFWPNRRRHQGNDSQVPFRKAENISNGGPRSRCGICFEQVSVTRPVDMSYAACPHRGSIGVAFWRATCLISTIL